MNNSYKKRMELRNPTCCWGFLTSPSANILVNHYNYSPVYLLVLIVVVAMNAPVNHASSTKQLGNETDRTALLELKHQISDDPNGVMDSWNHSHHHCQWQGVTCGTRHQRVTALTLIAHSLSGTISPHIGNLSFLKFILLDENRFHGTIPREIGRLFRLRYLSLSNNTLGGEISKNLSRCSDLRALILSRNNLEGKIPTDLGYLKKLELFYLPLNNLTGNIPSSIGNLSSLKELSVTFNNLVGYLPKEMAFLTSLTKLGVSANRLSGKIPVSIYNNSAFVIISLAQNFFHGNLPTDMGLKLPNMLQLLIGGNNFNGNIPVSITNASALEFLDFAVNKFEGQVPIHIGYLSRLQRLNLAGNLLGSNYKGDLDFFSTLTNCSNLKTVLLDGNNFGGEIPRVVANLSYKLSKLRIGGNQLSGAIPEGLGNLVNLYIFDVTGKSLSGSMPIDLGKLQNLQFLGLGANKLSGEILFTLCNVTSLYHVDLSSNRFEGSNIFNNVLMNCQNLQDLDISHNSFSGVISPKFFDMHPSLVSVDLGHNSFSGSLPVEGGKLIQLVDFSVAYNKFSGEIPPSLIGCLNLEIVYMQDNFFQGIIPPNLVSLRRIKELDLSSNNLQGNIPRDLERLQYLMYLNLSYNDLDGKVPNTGIFGNASQISLIGNKKLCGGIPELHLPSCPMVKGNNKRMHKAIIILCTVLPMIVLVLGATMFFYSLKHKKRYTRNVDFQTVPTGVHNLLRVSYHELHRATNGFSSECLIGSGSFGVVYKGRLEQHGDRLVAIKVLDLQKNESSKSFKVECRALKNIRHRNLVSILCYCSSIEFKAVVYDFMENGNLDSWLHPQETDETTVSRYLNLFQRLNIAIDVASALHYLHSHCETTVVHCDIKPCNILLDKDLVAHVGDFGIARLLPKTIHASSEQGTSSAIAFKGSIGYAAPE
ncbi:hypothetical protein ACH5RR_039569 [Cinchona calisaya]|uniref:non-specific serine/threonine protein kinase n=1 Tax=Cinchona calisaya TaxID=153742 RepID=A0ABD2Y0B9_9GENT